MKTVKLTPLSRRHLEATWRWVNRPDLKPLTGTLYPISWHEHIKWYNELRLDPLRRLFAVEAPGLGHIGNTGIKRFYPEDRCAELLIYIGDPACRGQGLGTAATRSLVDLCFGELGLHRVFVTVFAYNKIALASYRKAGFEKEAVWRDHLFRDGGYHHVIVMSRIHRGS